MEQQKVLLTGASGFIGTHILNILLKRGFNVVTVVRSQEKADYILTKFKGYPVETAIVKDIQEPTAFDDVLQDNAITSVIHTASPCFGSVKDSVKQMLNPAVEGTKNILKSIKKNAPQVAEVVITSSYVSILNNKKKYDNSFVQNEETWSDVTWNEALADPSMAYKASKKYAELAFWDFIETEKPNFTGTVVNPPWAFGPVLQNVTSIDQLNVSSQHLWRSVVNSPPNDTSSRYTDELPTVWADVRDIALAHVLPLERPELAGKRLLVVGGYYDTQMALDVVNRNFPKLKGKIAVGKPGTGLKRLNQVSQVDNNITNELLRLKYHKFENCIVDSFKSFIEIKEKQEKNKCTT